MKHKKKLFALAILPVIGLGILGASTASAHGLGGFGGYFSGTNATPDEIASRQTQMFQNQADLLGISVDTVKQGWSEGKTLEEIAAGNGINQTQLQEKIKSQRIAQLKSRLQTLVEKGVITQSQADKRLQVMESRTTNNGGMMGRGPHRGFSF